MWLDPDLVPDLVNDLCLKDCIRTINPLYHLAKISKFQSSYSQFTYQVSDTIRTLSASRSSLESHPYSRGDPGVQPAAVLRAQQALGCPLFIE